MNSQNGSSDRIPSGEHNAYEQEGFNGSIIGSARTEGGGMIVNRNVTARNRVSLPGGGQTNVATAVLLGYLTKNPDGSFSDATGQAAAEGQPDVTAEVAAEGDTEDQPESFTLAVGGQVCEKNGLELPRLDNWKNALHSVCYAA